MKIAATLLNQRALGLSLVDLGCGSGRLIELLHVDEFPSVTGIDFAESAISEARLKAWPQNVRFECADVTGELPEADCYVGLGLLDWLTTEDIQLLLSRMQGKKFLFSFSERRPSLTRLIHAAYRRAIGSTLRPEELPQYHLASELLSSIPEPERRMTTILRPRSMLFGSFLTNLEPQ